jgi:hypothetical protein
VGAFQHAASGSCPSECAGAFALYLPGVTWGLPSELPAAINSSAPFDSLEFVALYTNPNVANRYPAVQPLLALRAYGAVVLTNKLAGNFTSVSNAWPYGFRDPYAAFSDFVLLRNLMLVALAIGFW